MKIRVGFIFGGMSVEHEVSIISGLQALHALVNEKYEAVPIYISKKGEWFTGDGLKEIDNYKNIEDLLDRCNRVVLHKNEAGRHQLVDPKPKLFKKNVFAELDVVFPVTHGTFGEDGALQGLLELQKIPYVGCDVTSSAIGMDKVVMKTLIRAEGLPTTDFVWFYSKKWEEDASKHMREIEEKLGYPVIVKPANLGSSVGIAKAGNQEELTEAVEAALQFSSKIIVETMISDLIEVNCSVVGDFEDVMTSTCEEVIKTSDILSYQDKYVNDSTKGMGGQKRIIPANISAEVTKQINELAAQTFTVLGCNGVSRIDFLIDKQTNHIYVNEINTIPGSLSFYLWEPSGVSFSKLTEKLIELALKRDSERSNLHYSYDTNILALQGKGGKQGTKQ